MWGDKDWEEQFNDTLANGLSFYDTGSVHLTEAEPFVLGEEHSAVGYRIFQDEEQDSSYFLFVFRAKEMTDLYLELTNTLASRLAGTFATQDSALITPPQIWNFKQFSKIVGFADYRKRILHTTKPQSVTMEFLFFSNFSANRKVENK